MAALFSNKSLHEVIEGWRRSAIADVERLDRSRFDDPALAGQLDQVAERYGALQVATLQKEAMSGQRREVEQARNDYGRQITVRSSVLDVTIPFSGSAESFGLHPSSSVIVTADFRLIPGAIVITVHDGQNRQREVDDFVKNVSQNLDTIRNEIEAARPRIKAAVHEAAAARRARIKEERERDATLSFPVR